MYERDKSLVNMDKGKRKLLFSLIVFQSVMTVYIISTYSRYLYIDDRRNWISGLNESAIKRLKRSTTINDFHNQGDVMDKLGVTSNKLTEHVDPKQHVNNKFNGGGNDTRLILTSHAYVIKHKPIISKCQVKCPFHIATNGSWQYVAEDFAIVYSAFYMDDSVSVVVVGARVKAGRGPPICQLWFDNGVNITMEDVASSVSDFPENKGRRFTATLFRCSVPTKTKPSYISLVREQCTNATNLLVIQSTKASEYRRRFTVCLMPLNFRYSRAFEISEWIELNRILGAQKFTIYNYSSEYNIQKVLEHYSDQGLVEVLQWNMPLVVDTWPPSDPKPQIHYFGQLAALQDCLYRNKLESEFVVNLDLDEFIIPRQDNAYTWPEMMSSVPRGKDSYVFQNTFYRKEWNDTTENFPNKTIAIQYKLVTLLKTKRENKIMSPGVRSKYIARTTVERLHVHDVPRVSRFNVPINFGILHHYRNWLQYDYPEEKKIQDGVIVKKYANNLTENVRKLWNHFPDLPLDLHTTDEQWANSSMARR